MPALFSLPSKGFSTPRCSQTPASTAPDSITGVEHPTPGLAAKANPHGGLACRADEGVVNQVDAVGSVAQQLQRGLSAEHMAGALRADEAQHQKIGRAHV